MQDMDLYVHSSLTCFFILNFINRKLLKKMLKLILHARCGFVCTIQNTTYL